MTGRPAKTLEAHLREGTFLGRRESHRRLLLGAPLRWPNFASLQLRYQQAHTDADKRAIALEFERLARAAHTETSRRLGQQPDRGAALQSELDALGKPGSLARLLGFFPAYLAHPKGDMIGAPFQLEPWQRAFLREFSKRDRHGRRVYRTGVLGVPRGNGKTPLAAALGLYELLNHTNGPEVYCAACSREQAGIALEFARSFVEDGPLADWIEVKKKLVCPATRGVMQVISSEGRMQHGRMPSVAIFDELWAFTTAAERQAYVSLASALHKRDDAYLLSITTAGYDDTSLLGDIYKAALTWPDVQPSKSGCLTIAKDTDNGQLLWWYGAPDGADLEDEYIWRACNPASWTNFHDLRRQLHDPGLGELEFRRLNLNMWTRTRDAWLPAGLWRDLASDTDIPAGAEIYIGVDVGIHHDTTAVCWAHVLADGRIVLRTHVWAVDPDAHAHYHFDPGPVRLAVVEDFIRDLAREYRVVEVAYDPNFFHRSAETLADEGITTVEFLQASGPMADAYQAFYQLAQEGTLTHDGDPVLAAHIDATAATKTERGWRLRKLKNTQRIDATVAACLAVARARHHEDTTPQIRWLEF